MYDNDTNDYHKGRFKTWYKNDLPPRVVGRAKSDRACRELSTVPGSWSVVSRC